jgi:sugar phosphate isomerase/epimerase
MENPIGECSRRSFLGAASWLAAGEAFARPLDRTAPGELRLGVATYSLRKFSRPEAIRMLGQLGVRYVSIKSFHLPYESSPEELRRGAQEFRDAGFAILSGGNIDLTKPAELRAMFEYAKTCGMPMMVCAPSHATLDAVEKLVQEYDIKTAIHNHGPEDRHFPTPESVLEAVRRRDPRMGLCIDCGHTTRTGADVVEWIRRAGPRLFDIHIKDLKDLLGKETQCPVGEGAMPVVAIFKQLRAMNYQGGVMLEYEIDADNPLPGMIRSLAYMRGVLDGLAG